MLVQGYRAWYTEDRTFDSESTAWDDLPSDGCLFVMLYFDENAPSGMPLRRAMSGSDWYFREGEVYGHNCDSLEENQARYPNGSFKRGQWTDDEEMTRVNNLAHESRTAPWL